MFTKRTDTLNRKVIQFSWLFTIQAPIGACVVCWREVGGHEMAIYIFGLFGSRMNDRAIQFRGMLCNTKHKILVPSSRIAGCVINFYQYNYRVNLRALNKSKKINIFIILH
jgi:hypothetical protein